MVPLGSNFICFFGTIAFGVFIVPQAMRPKQPLDNNIISIQLPKAVDEIIGTRTVKAQL